MKRCSKCEEEKPLEEFAPRKNSPVGYYAACRECTRAAGRLASRQWRERNPEKVAEANRRFREQNPKYQLEWYHRNAATERERRRIVMERCRKENPAADRERRRRYRERHPDVIAEREREKTYSRRAKMPFSSELAALMAEMVAQPCAYCGATENITIDHIEPLSRGGRHEASNLAPACFSCNCSKGAKPLEEWLAQRA